MATLRCVFARQGAGLVPIVALLSSFRYRMVSVKKWADALDDKDKPVSRDNKKPCRGAGLFSASCELAVQGLCGVQGVFQQAGAGHWAYAARHGGNPACAR